MLVKSASVGSLQLLYGSVCYIYMKQYIAFIRGINAGLRIKMIDLSHLFEELGHKNCKTILATGNVIFDTPETDKEIIALEIEKAIERKHNYPTAVILYTKSDLEKLVATDPFRDITPSPQQTPHVSFTKTGAGSLPFDLPRAVPQKGYTILSMADDAVCSVLDLSGGTHPNLLATLDRAFGKQVTTRNWKTVERCFQAMK